MNDTLNTIFNRKSIRKYSEKKVDKEIIDLLIKAGLSAPSNVNKMPWEFIVIDDKEILERISNVTLYAKMTKDAPLAIVVCGNKDRALPGEGSDFWVQDCSAASQNILLAAHSLGLGAVWTGVYPTADRIRNVSKAIGNVPENIIPLSLIPIGYPAEDEKNNEKTLPLDRIHYNGY